MLSKTFLILPLCFLPRNHHPLRSFQLGCPLASKWLVGSVQLPLHLVGVWMSLSDSISLTFCFLHFFFTTMQTLVCVNCLTMLNDAYSRIQVRLGEHNSNTDPDCTNGVCAPKVQDIDVEEYDCHKGYNKTSFHHDICLIRLAKPIQFNGTVSFYTRLFSNQI